MKNLILVCLIGILVPVQVFCQKEITFDFKTQKTKIDGITFPDQKYVLDYNTTYSFKVTNVDTRRFGEFSMNPLQQNLFDEAPVNFFNLISIKLKQNESSVEKTNTTCESITNKLNEKSGTTEPGKLQKEKAAKDKEIGQIEAYQNQFAVLAKDEKLISDALNRIDGINQLNNKIYELTGNFDLTNDQIKTNATQIEKEYKSVLISGNTPITSFYDRYKLYLIDSTKFVKNKVVVEVLKKHDTLQRLLNLFFISVNSMKTAVDSLRKDNVYLKLLNSLQAKLIRLKGETITEITLGSFKPTKDKITVNIIYKEANLKRLEDGYVYPKSNPVEFEVRGGVKISFSTGLMLTSFLYDRRYSVYPVGDSDSSFITQDKNYNIFQPTVAALMHVGKRSVRSISWAFSWGIGTNVTELSNLTFYIGGSMIFGKDDRFIVSCGFSAAAVDYLNGKYELEKNISNAQLDKEDLYKKAFRPGVFIGFSYNLSKPQSTTAESNKE